MLVGLAAMVFVPGVTENMDLHQFMSFDGCSQKVKTEMHGAAQLTGEKVPRGAVKAPPDLKSHRGLWPQEGRRSHGGRRCMHCGSVTWHPMSVKASDEADFRYPDEWSDFK